MYNFIYIKIDFINNLVFSKGISFNDFMNSIIHYPKNLILLGSLSSITDGDYDINTWFKIINEKDIKNYFLKFKKKKKVITKWIDFISISNLKELTPIEISEILYLGHMKKSINSPFFYKLQNNFVVFCLIDNVMKIYYRYIDEFYRVLSKKIKRLVFLKINYKKKFYNKKIFVEKLDYKLLKNINFFLKEGIVFVFKNDIIFNNEYKIFLYIYENNILNINFYNNIFKKKIIFIIIYNFINKNWIIKKI